LRGQLPWQGQTLQIEGEGTGPIDAFVHAVAAALDCDVRVLDYNEHAISEGAHAKAVAYVEMRIDDRHTVYGVGMDANIVSASIRAILSGLQRAPQVQAQVMVA
ncbi:MAG: alpha-isopropylmalate synthase regulatory domain-containing protein, partial [Diaphorobacter nitroreducens]